MLAARDQENLIHGHQQAAASKPLNQGIKQLAPKTPGNKVPKTPFKLPLNDENGPGLFGAGKTGLKNNGKGNENLVTGTMKGGLGEKDAFKTPMGPRNRAPLGLKTTNAKTKAFHIPPPPSVEDAPDKSQQKSASASARKGRPRVSHAEMTKLDIHGDLDKLKEMDIEYMPPPAKNLPDYPDDIHETNLTPFPDGKGLMDNWWADTLNKPDIDGLSYLQRQELARQKEYELLEKEQYAEALRDTESIELPCECEPECPYECKKATAAKKAAEEKYQRTMAELYPERKPAALTTTTIKPSNTKTVSRKATLSKGPSTLTSKSAATALSQRRPTATTTKPISQPSTTKPRLPFSHISSRKQTPPPTNPSSMRHTAATLASKTTIGRSAGRATSATLRKNNSAAGPKQESNIPDTTLPPREYMKRYGQPKAGSRMWESCWRDGCLFKSQEELEQEEAEEEEGPSLEDVLRMGAEEDFVLELED